MSTESFLYMFYVHIEQKNTTLHYCTGIGTFLVMLSRKKAQARTLALQCKPFQFAESFTRYVLPRELKREKAKCYTSLTILVPSWYKPKKSSKRYEKHETIITVHATQAVVSRAEIRLYFRIDGRLHFICIIFIFLT